MTSQNSKMARNSVLLLGAALTLDSAWAATTRDGVPQQPGANGSPTSVEVRISARHAGTSRFRVIYNGATLLAGDEVRISMIAGELTYAYIFHRGSGGDWRLIFPNPEESEDPSAANPVRSGEVCSVPGDKSRLVVDGVPGVEEFVIYALPRPDHDVVESLAARLRRGEHPHIKFDGPSEASGLRPPDAASEEGLKSILTEVRDLSVVPTQSDVETKLPPNYALHLKYLNAGVSPASKLP